MAAAGLNLLAGVACSPGAKSVPNVPEVEPNDDSGHATSLGGEANVDFRGHCSPAGDPADWYQAAIPPSLPEVAIFWTGSSRLGLRMMTADAQFDLSTGGSAGQLSLNAVANTATTLFVEVTCLVSTSGAVNYQGAFGR